MPPLPLASSSRAYSCSTYWDRTRTGRPGTSRRAASAALIPSSVKVGGSLASTMGTSRPAAVPDGPGRRVRGHRGQQVSPVVARGGDLQAVGLEHPGQAVSQEKEVFGNDNSHGISMV